MLFQNGWDIIDSEYELQLQTMPGLDKMVAKHGKPYICTSMIIVLKINIYVEK